MKSLNRRLWSVPQRRGVTDVVEFSVPLGVIGHATALKFVGLDGLRELVAVDIMRHEGATARNQEPSQ